LPDRYPLLIKGKEGRLLTNVHRGGNELSAVDTIARRTHDFRHVRPHSIPAFTAEPAAVAGAFYRYPPGSCFVANRVNVPWCKVRVTKPEMFGIRMNLYHFGILDGAAQASHTGVTSGREPSYRSGEDAI
jgi:hypothetical protein